MTRNEEINKKIASLIIALLPLFEYYSIFISALDLATVCILLFFGYVLLTSKIKISLPPITILLAYITLMTPLMWLVFSESGIKGYANFSSIILRYGKLVLLISITFLLGIYKLFDLEMAMKYMRVVVYTSAVFIVIQRLSYSFGMEIVNPLDNFVRYGDGGDHIVSQGLSGLYRPSAFFFEPAHLAQYVLIFMCLSLFGADGKKRFIDALLGTIAIICSTSGQGLLLLVILYCLYAISLIKINMLRAFYIIFTVILSAIILSQFEFVQMAIERIFADDYEQSAIAYRMGDGYEIFNKLPWIFKLFGCGFGNVPIRHYLNGLEYILNTLGISGCLIFICLLIYYFTKSNLTGKAILIIWFCLIIGAQVFSGVQICFIFCFIASCEK